MPWEFVKGRSSFGVEPLGMDEVSIVQTTNNRNKDKKFYRMNVHLDNFPKDTKSVKLAIDKEKQRIGLFKCPLAEAFEGKGLTKYSDKSKVRYITLPRTIIELGFEKGRYQIVKKKEQPEDMYFYISVKGKKEGKKEEAKEKTE